MTTSVKILTIIYNSCESRHIDPQWKKSWFRVSLNHFGKLHVRVFFLGTVYLSKSTFIYTQKNITSVKILTTLRIRWNRDCERLSKIYFDPKQHKILSKRYTFSFFFLIWLYVNILNYSYLCGTHKSNEKNIVPWCSLHINTFISEPKPCLCFRYPYFCV